MTDDKPTASPAMVDHIRKMFEAVAVGDTAKVLDLIHSPPKGAKSGGIDHLFDADNPPICRRLDENG